MVRVCRVVIVLLLVAIPLVAQTAPPRDLHFVRDHWTAYNPPDPATFPPDSEVHIIQRGDTLWDLAASYYGDPYLWPQLWENNTYITDAHWIYPGDPLLIEGEALGTTLVAEDLDAFGTEPEIPEEPAPVVTARQGLDEMPPRPLGSTHDIYCFGHLGHPNEPLPNVIAAFEDTETRFIEGAIEQSIGGSSHDVVFIDGGTSTGLIAGETYLVVQPGELVFHPRTEELLGRQYDYRGRIRILCADSQQATGMIVEACTSILVGNRLKPLPQLPIPIARIPPLDARCEVPSGKATGFIVNSKDYRMVIGEGSVVQIDLGWEDFIQPGDFLTVYRENRIPGFPRLVLGQLGILTAESHTATARVLQMRFSMEVGDRVELR